jgi:Na+/H+ antiporter NhaA
LLVCHEKLAGLAIPMARTAALAVCHQALLSYQIPKECDAIDSPSIFEVTCICPLL